MKRMTINIISGFVLCSLLGTDESAWALQSHGPPEGIYVHQMAHLLFMAALGYLFWHTRRTQELKNRGWKYLQVFCVLLFLWNIVAITGHEVQQYLETVDFINRDTLHEQLASPLSFVKVLYYITKMDHFFFAPGLLALAFSLRFFYLEAQQVEKT